MFAGSISLSACDEPHIRYRDSEVTMDASDDVGADVPAICDGADCESAPAPQSIAPTSTAILSGRRPTFRVRLDSGVDGARFEICRDRGCTIPETTFDAVAETASVDHDLAPGTYFWRTRGLRGSIAGGVSPTWQLEITGRGGGSVVVGHRVDHDGNGFADPIVAAPMARAGQGQLFVYSGASTALSMVPTASPFSTDVDVARFGAAISAAGDVDGDGFGDVVVGAPGAASGEGRVYLYRGSASGLGSAAIAIDAPSGGAFGTAVAAGDVDRDGYTDLVVGAPGAGAGGTVYVFAGGPSGPSTTTPSAVISGTDANGHFGDALLAGIDCDGDGIEDLVVGAPDAASGAGVVSAFLGSTTGIQTSAAIRIASPDSAGSGFGSSIAAVGDFDADGRGDVVIGAPRFMSGRGRAYVLRGAATTGLSSAPSASLDAPDGGGFGAAVAGGDVNGNGFADVIVGAPDASSTAGRAYVFDGASTGITTTAGSVLSGTGGAAEEFASSLSAADANGDGRADVLVGAAGAQSSAGRAYVFLGQMAALGAAGLTLNGPSSGGRFGAAVGVGE